MISVKKDRNYYTLTNLNIYLFLIGYNTKHNSSLKLEEVLACVASVSVWFRSKKRGTRVKDRAKNGARKRAGRGCGRKEVETLADKLRDFENRPLGLSCLSAHIDI